MKNTKPKINALESAKIIFAFIQSAREWSRKEEFNYQLASAFIYANLAEVLAESFLVMIIVSINQKLLNSLWKLDNKNGEDEPTNLEHLIRKLAIYDFPNKDKVMSLLHKIKNSRNKLFHSLIKAEEKGISRNGLIKNVQRDVEKLITFHTELLKY